MCIAFYAADHPDLHAAGHVNQHYGRPVILRDPADRWYQLEIYYYGSGGGSAGLRYYTYAGSSTGSAAY